jgi:predicted enzyme related to lactoylglutathione lyase
MPVSGIGGLFFRARNPTALSAWYKTHFGIGEADRLWKQAAGPTVFAPFSDDTDYFPAEKQWMLNLRVTDIDAMIAHLREHNIEVITKPEWDTPETGRFARVYDPEGNAIELWQLPPEEP